MQMKPYLFGQGVFHFIDGSMTCPPSHVSDSFVGPSSTINPFFLRWKQQDQLILSALLSSLSLRGCVASCGRLSYLALCLAYSWESPSVSVQFSHHATPWFLPSSSTRWLFGKYLHAASQIIIWRIGCCQSPHVLWRLQYLCVSWWVQRLGNESYNQDKIIVVCWSTQQSSHPWISTQELRSVHGHYRLSTAFTSATAATSVAAATSAHLAMSHHRFSLGCR